MSKSSYIYRYDGSFVNLLTLLAYLYKSRIKPQNIKSHDYVANLFDEIVDFNLASDEEVVTHLIHSLGLKIFNYLYLIFLSNQEDKELLMYYFLVYSYRYKAQVFYMHNIKSVNLALKVAHYVQRETHKLKGFLRFRELESGLLYAEMAPTNNIIFLLAKHFVKRLPKEVWLIKDVKRNILCLYDGKHLQFLDDVEYLTKMPDISDKEQGVMALWQTFYDTIGIKERKNDRCRQNFMPKKYWQYIIEMSGENEKSC